MFDRAVMAGREEELQGLADLLGDRVAVVGGQAVAILVALAARALGELGIGARDAVGVGDGVGQHVTAEGVLARIDGATVLQDVERSVPGADVDQREARVRAVLRQRRGEQAKGVFECIGLDVDDHRFQPGLAQRLGAQVDVLAAGGDQQDVLLRRLAGRAAKNFEVEIDLFQRERDVLRGFELEGALDLGVAQFDRHRNGARDDAGARNRDDRLLERGFRFLGRLADGRANRGRVAGVAVVHGSFRQLLRAVGLDLEPPAGPRQLHELDGRGADVDSHVAAFLIE